MELQFHTELINYYIKKNNYNSYLEIGLDKPEQNYLYVCCENKESVDPYTELVYDAHYSKDNLPEDVKSCLTYLMTSDEMFSNMSEDKLYDIIFIDGYHTEEQCDKDIMNSLKHLSDDGMIIVHDTLPVSEISQRDVREQSVWYGSVWKSIPKLKDYNVNYYTVNEECGCTVITKKDNFEQYYYIEKSNLTWDDYVNNYISLLNCVEAPEDIDTFKESEISIIYNREKKINKSYENIDKYIVCACAKNENDYIIEWIEHYLKLGFDKIIIADNNEDESLLDVVKAYIDNGTVSVYNFRNVGCFQVEMYSLMTKDGEYRWCGYFDCDEFLELPGEKDIKSYLAKHEDNDVICFNWLMYSSNLNDDKNISIQERFNEPLSPLYSFKDNMFIKSIVKGGKNNKFCKECKFNGSHIPYTNRDDIKYLIGGHKETNSTTHMSFPPIYKDGYLKHYYTKSFTEWCNKAGRGWPDGTDKLRLTNYFIFNSVNIPKEKNTVSLFSSNDFSKMYNEELDKYDVIEIRGYNNNMYAFITGICRQFYGVKNKTFVVTENIDDTFYNILLQEAFNSGNRLISCKEEEVWGIYEKYNTGINYTYYILTFW